MEQWRIEKLELIKRYREQNRTAVKGQVVFTGSSLMEMFPIDEWSRETEGAPIVYNRGVGGYTTAELYSVLDACVLDLMPKKVFINIGTNDLSDSRVSIDQVIQNYDRILNKIEEGNSGVKIYLMAYYPVNPEVAAGDIRKCLETRTNAKINEANKRVQELAARHKQQFIDVNAALKDANGNLRADYTIEGIHIKPAGYRAILKQVMQYVLQPE